MNARYFFLILLIPLIGIARSENEVETVEDSGTGSEGGEELTLVDPNPNYVCPEMAGFFQHEVCSMFYMCNMGHSALYACPPGKLYDARTYSCQKAEEVSCDNIDRGSKEDEEPTLVDPNPNYVCPELAGHFRHEVCSMFYMCNMGHSALYACPKGKLYDARTYSCQKAEEVSCDDIDRGSGEDEEPTLVDPNPNYVCPEKAGFFRHENCSMFYMCNMGHSALYACPPGKLYDARTYSCQKAEEVSCDDIDRGSEEGEEPTLVDPNPNYVCPELAGHFRHEVCSMFYMCNMGHSALYACPPGKLYDARTYSCRKAEEVSCDDTNKGERELAWPWEKRTKFVCPSLFGTFADILDCSAFYICVGGISNRKSCNRGQQFDKYRKICLPFLFAVCDKGDGDDTTKRPTTKNDDEVSTKGTFSCPSIVGKFEHPDDCSKYYSCTFYISSLKTCPKSELFDADKKECRSAKKVKCGTRPKPTGDDDDTTKRPTTSDDGGRTTKDKFTCPSIIGSFMHPDDCSKYYSCTLYIPTLRTCPESELFDGVKKQCKPAKDVNCGTRQKPTDAITEEITTTPISTETPTPTEPETPPTEPETPPTEPETPPTEPETTPTEPETTTPTEPEPTTTTTTEEPTTTPKPRVTAPDTECDEDDVDCIIDDLGETPDWFVCTEDLGSYPHPSSKKLFIFCLNWKPFVKKCGQDLVFSEDLMTCTHS